ncbi:MAG: dienelactone hydrolase family protein [Rhodospirillaceae bacterium]|nr:dienelactone hydrolase family protein [Rhodospirillaceae bacterium]
MKPQLGNFRGGVMFGWITRAVLGAIVVFGLSIGDVDAALKSKTEKYKVGDREFTGYLVYDDARVGPRPGVIVVHEWWGHDAYARSRADKLAAEGYTAFALDMYGTGRLAGHPKDAGAFAKEVLKTKGVMHARFKAAYNLLKQHKMVDASKTAAIGYCFGGNVVLDMARAGVDLKGVAAFHASLTQTVKAKPGEVKAKVRVFNGADDPFIKPEKLMVLKEGMKAAGADFKYVAYPGVVHSFTSPSATERGKKLKLPLRYDRKADQDSWSQTLALFDQIFK